MTTYGTVRHVERLSPSMMRVEFDGPGLDGFEPSDATDQYVNALFVPDGAPYQAPFDVEEAKEAGPDQRPLGRRYTVRRWDPVERVLTIDFVVHGDVGYAGRWAQNARPGDRLQMTGPSGNHRPDTDADWYLLVGDESALPAIAATSEALAADARATAVVVVDGPDCEIDLPAGPNVDVMWLHRSTCPDPDTVLVDAVSALDWPEGRVDVFVHGEAGEVRAVRKLLLAERGVDRSKASISPYWRRDHTDEAWREIKRRWLADQEADV